MQPAKSRYESTWESDPVFLQWKRVAHRGRFANNMDKANDRSSNNFLATQNKSGSGAFLECGESSPLWDFGILGVRRVLAALGF
jgi:hypothetical protein